MASVEKISIALTPDMAALVRQAVDSGEYASSSEVMRDALRDWKHKRAIRQQQIEELRRLWQEEITSGPGRFEGIDGILQEAGRRFEAERRKPKTICCRSGGILRKIIPRRRLACCLPLMRSARCWATTHNLVAQGRI